jgi:branched-chain amino acid transport system permease protein
MENILQLAVYGIVIGSIIGLGSMGLTLSYGVTKFANFAHGDIMSLAMYFAYFIVVDLGLMGPTVFSLSFGWGMFLAIIATIILLAIFSIAVDKLIYKKLRRDKSNIVTMAIASLGVGIIIRAAVTMIWGPSARTFVPGIHEAIPIVGNILIKPDQIFIVGLTLIVTLVMYYLLYHTKLGKAMRATADNPDLAAISGINIDNILAYTWAITGALTAVAGIMLGIQAQVYINLGFNLLLPMFAAVILGGIGNPWGALIGGFVVAISSEVSTAWIATGYKPAVPFVILIIMLIVRPRGIFGSNI